MNRLKSIGIKTRNRKRMYTNLKYPQIPLSATDLYVVSTIGDRLDILANDFYKDKTLWWIIAVANPGIIKGDSWFIKPGIRFRIPPNAEPIINSYNQLNLGNR